MVSEWVSREIIHFKQIRAMELRDTGTSVRRVFGILADGVPFSGDPRTECFPAALTKSVDVDGELTEPTLEPFAPDVRRDGREGAALRLIAGLLDLDFEDLLAREEARRRAERRRSLFLFTTGIVLTILAMVGMISAAILGWRNTAARSDLLAAVANQSVSEKRPDQALLFALAASPAAGGDVIPFRPAAHRALTTATLQTENLLAAFRPHDLDVLSAASNAAGTAVLTAAIDGGVRVTDCRTGHQTWSRDVRSPIRWVAWSSDGAHIAATTMNGITFLWHTDRVSPETYALRAGSPVALQFSQSGARLLVASSDGVSILRTRDWVVEKTFAAVSVSHAAISPNEDVVAIAHHNGSVDLIERTSGRLLWNIVPHEGSIHHISFSSDGTRLLTASYDRSASLIRISTGAVISKLRASGVVLAAAFSPDGSRVATTSSDGVVEVYDGRTGSEILFFPTNSGWTAALALSFDGNLVAVGSRDAVVHIIDVKQGIRSTQLTGHQSEITYVSFSSDASTLASVSVDGSLRTWRTTPRSLICARSFEPAEIRQIAAPLGNGGIAVLLDNGVVQLVRASDCGTAAHQPFFGSRIVELLAAASGSTLVGRSEQGRVEFWDVEHAHTLGYIDSIARDTPIVIAKEGTLLGAIERGSVRLWSLQREIQPILVPGIEHPKTASVGIGSQWLVIATEGRSLVAVDRRGKKSTVRATLPARPNGAMRFSPDGASITVPLDDGSAAFWEIGSTPRRFKATGRRIIDAIPRSDQQVIHVITDPPGVEQLSMATFEPVSNYPLPLRTGICTLATRERWMTSTTAANRQLVVNRMLPGGLDLVRYSCSVLPLGRKSLAPEDESRAQGVLSADDRVPCSRRRMLPALRALTRFLDHSYYAY